MFLVKTWVGWVYQVSWEGVSGRDSYLSCCFTPKIQYWNAIPTVLKRMFNISFRPKGYAKIIFSRIFVALTGGHILLVVGIYYHPILCVITTHKMKPIITWIRRGLSQNVAYIMILCSRYCYSFQPSLNSVARSGLRSHPHWLLNLRSSPGSATVYSLCVILPKITMLNKTSYHFSPAFSPYKFALYLIAMVSLTRIQMASLICKLICGCL